MSYRESQKQWVEEHNIEAGDTVLIRSGKESRPDGFLMTWVDAMNLCIGHTGKIRCIENFGVKVSVRVENEPFLYYYPFQCLERINIKVGDWVWSHEESKAFKARGIQMLPVSGLTVTAHNGKGRLYLHDAIRLIPLRTIDDLLVEDRLVRLQGSDAGTILTVIYRNGMGVTISPEVTLREFGEEWRGTLKPGSFAKVPYTKESRDALLKKFEEQIMPRLDAASSGGEFPKAKYRDIEFLPSNLTLDAAYEYDGPEYGKVLKICPNPELEGTWDYCGDGYCVVWIDDQFVASQIHGADTIENWEPGEFWKQIERAPVRAVAHKPLPRPKYRFKTPVNPYDL